MSSQVNSGQNDRPRHRMTRAQVVKKFLTEVVCGIDIQNEEIGLGAEDKILRFFQAVRDIYLRSGRSLA